MSKYPLKMLLCMNLFVHICVCVYITDGGGRSLCVFIPFFYGCFSKDSTRNIKCMKSNDKAKQINSILMQFHMCLVYCNH